MRRSIFDQPAPEKKAEPIKATSMFGASVAVKPLEKGKTVLFNTSVGLSQIDVKDTDLIKFSDSKDVRRKAIAFILQTNINNPKLEYVMSIGQPEQERHRIIAETCMKLSVHDTLKACQSKLTDLIKLVTETEHPSQQNGILSKFSAFRENAEEKFQNNLTKIKAVSSELSTLSGGLQTLIQTGKKVIVEINKLAADLEPIIISCQFFSEYEKGDFPNNLYVSRLTGLLTTRLSLNQNTIQLQSLEQNTIGLIDTIAQVVLTDIPQWMTNCADSAQKQSILSKLKR